jgi:hypothetical protein
MSAPQLAPGSVVAGKYQVGACLGYSGSSATYQAAGADGREVVLKIFDPAIRQRADIMQALEQTYASTNALPQDVAVPLLDAGYDPATGAPFSVSERIPFPSLAQLAAQRPLSPEEVSNILGLMAHVLDQAHARQLFHHAIKPTNIFVGFAQGYGIRITDFGASLGRAAVPTQEGYALAAPWISPEQAQAQAPAGAAADVFSTGLLMFYALTGRSYWRSCQGALDLGGWQREIMSPRMPPSQRAMQLGALLNANFDGLIACALSIDPGQRYRSVGELAHALEGLVGAPAPESQATMAFPASALGLNLGGAGDYPPPPAPMGGMGMPQPTLQGVGQPMPGQMGGGQQMPGQMGGGQQMPGQMGGGGQQMASGQQMLSPVGGQQMPPQGQANNSAYVSTQSSQAALGETAAGRPIDPAVFQRRAPPNRLAPILVGVAALVLLGGAAAAWIVMGRKSGDPGPATASSGSAAAVASGSAAPAADTGTPAASAAPADSGSAAPADAPSAEPSASGSADPGPASPEISFSCDPECDEIKADDKALDLTKPISLAPGKHTITAAKAGYVTAKETVVVKAGQKLEKQFKLTAKPTAAAGPATGPGPGPGPSLRKCTKFIKTNCK